MLGLWLGFDERCDGICKENNVLLLTGLVNPQVIRTAEMMDIKAVAFVRGKSLKTELLSWLKKKVLRCCQPAAPCLLPVESCTAQVLRGGVRSIEQ
jgi:hypothetical protein